jgi:hypothetical protein
MYKKENSIYSSIKKSLLWPVPYSWWSKLNIYLNFELRFQYVKYALFRIKKLKPVINKIRHNDNCNYGCTLHNFVLMTVLYLRRNNQLGILLCPHSNVWRGRQLLSLSFQPAAPVCNNAAACSLLHAFHPICLPHFINISVKAGRLLDSNDRPSLWPLQ